MNDLTGQTFGFLTVLGPAEHSHDKSHAYFLCRCTCGNEKIIRGESLIRGDTKSCGCYRQYVLDNKTYNSRRYRCDDLV